MKIRRKLSCCFLLAAAPLSPGEPVAPKGMVQRLASDRFPDREQAQEELLGWARGKSGTRAPALVKLLDDEDPEIRKRAYVILRQLSDEDYLSDGHGYLGIMMGEEILQAGPNGKPGAGIRINRVMKGSPADASGLRDGDLIIALDGATWEKQGALDAFMDAIAMAKPLSQVVLTIRRNGGEPVDITAKLGKRPVPDLRFAQEDPQTLDMQAKEEHFKKWLNRLKPDRR